jgi:gas vesicle protein
MSYAGKDPRSRRTASSSAVASSASTRTRGGGGRVLERELAITARGVARPARGRPSRIEELDWQHIALFAAGALMGAAIGAGAALLFAPHSGERTRHELARHGRHLRARTADAWDDLRHELRYATRRGRRTLSRKLGRALRERQERRELRDEALADD